MILKRNIRQAGTEGMIIEHKFMNEVIVSIPFIEDVRIHISELVVPITTPAVPSSSAHEAPPPPPRNLGFTAPLPPEDASCHMCNRPLIQYYSRFRQCVQFYCLEIAKCGRRDHSSNYTRRNVQRHMARRLQSVLRTYDINRAY